MSTATTANTPAIPENAPGRVEHYRFTAEEYHRMGEAGVFGPEARVELIEGEIFTMSPIGSLHASVLARLNRLLVISVGERGIVQPQNPIVVNKHSEPQPDLTIVKPRDDFYAHQKPTPADALWLIEVADTTIAFDRNVKIPHYARNAIAETWLIDLPNRAIEVYTDPQPTGRYGSMRTFRAADRATPAAFPDITLSFNDVAGHAKS